MGRQLAAVIIGLMLALQLAGCALTPEEKQRRAERRALEERRKADEARRVEEKRLAGLRERCKTYGFLEGTTQMAQCVMNLDTAFKRLADRALVWYQAQPGPIRQAPESAHRAALDP